MLSVLKIKGRQPESRRNPEAEKQTSQAMPVHASGNSMTIAAGKISNVPQPTPKPSTTSRTGRKANLHTGALENRRGHWLTVRRRSLPDRRRVTRRYWSGRTTDRHGRKKMQWARDPGKSWRGGEGEGGYQNHHWTRIIEN